MTNLPRLSTIKNMRVTSCFDYIVIFRWKISHYSIIFFSKNILQYFYLKCVRSNITGEKAIYKKSMTNLPRLFRIKK